MNLVASVTTTAFAGAVLLATTLMFVIGGYVGVLRQRTGAGVPEGNSRFWSVPYSAASIHAFLVRAGKDGWHVYRVALWWDMAYAVVFAVTALVLIDGIWGAIWGVAGWIEFVVLLVPLVAGALDLVEDLLLLIVIGSSPVAVSGTLPGADVVALAALVTRAKFVAYGLVVIALLLGGTLLVARGTG